MLSRRKGISFILIFILVFNMISVDILAGSSVGKVEIKDFDLDGFQTFRFYVSANISTSKYKYKTIGWRVHISPDSTNEIFHADVPYKFENKHNDQVDLELIDHIFNPAKVDQIYRESGGKIEADAIQVVLLNGIPMGTDNKAVDPSTIIGWEEDTSILLNNSDVQKFTDSDKDDECFDGNSTITEKPILTEALKPFGIQWGPQSYSDLQNYYDVIENYKPVAAKIPVTLVLEPISTIDEQTLDMSKGEGQATVRIHASGTIDPDGKEGQIYAENYNNIRYISITIEGQEKKLYPNIDFTSLNYETEFTFNYLPNDIEDGDSDMNDEVRMRYDGSVHVEYKKKYYGDALGDTETNVIKKAPIPDGDPLAILSVPDEVLVDKEILADGSGSLAPEGATIVDYKWEVENQHLQAEDGNSKIKLTYNEPKTVTIALTVEDSNGKSDTALKDVIVKQKASPPSNWSPDVTLTGPNLVMQGDNLTLNINATDKEDGVLTPTLSKPSSLVLSGPVTNGENSATFTQSGTFTITAKATDSGGKSDSASIQVEVCPPKPLAIISETGDYKIGQTVVLDSSESKSVSKTYPIDWTLTKWTITPSGSLTSADIYYTKLNDKELAFTSKKTGKVEIALTVTNTLGYSNTRIIERTIVADTAPKADFTLIKKVYRDKDNDKKAIVRAFDASTSPDGDIITKRAWFYSFDSDNDGVFSDETWHYHNGTDWIDSSTTYDNLFNYADTVNTGNLTDVTVETNHVGKYKFELKVYEEHDNRLLEFVNTSYILTDDTADKPGEECIAEVDNIAPVTAVKVDVSQDEIYDIVVVTDYKDMDLIQLQTELNVLKAKAFASNKDFKIHMITDKVRTGQQHKVKNYYTYGRQIYLSYYLDGGYKELTSSEGNERTNYNHDYQSHTLTYETTQDYSTPTKPFEKGDHVEWRRTSFSDSKSGSMPFWDYSGVRFEFYNPDNIAATRINHDEITSGYVQTAQWARVFSNIGVVEEKVTISNTWTMLPNPTPHDYYYDITSMDFSKVKAVNYENGSKKIFLYFTKGTGFNYDYDGYNYSATNIDKDLLDHLIYNDFETYVITPNTSILDIKFTNKNYNSDITSQYASLRELAHCSPIRGKYILGGPTSQVWKDQLLHITKKNVVMPSNVTVENNVIKLKFDEPFKEGEEVDIKVLLEEFKISDLVGNEINEPILEYKIKHNDSGIKNLSSLCFSDPLSETVLNENVEVVKIIDYLTLYKEEGMTKVQITEQEKAKQYFSEEEINEIKELDYSTIEEIHIGYYFITVQYKDEHVKLYGKAFVTNYSPLAFTSTQWNDVNKIYATDRLVAGIQNNGNVVVTGYYIPPNPSSWYPYISLTYNYNMDSNYEIYDAVIFKEGMALLLRHKTTNEKSFYQIGNVGSRFLSNLPSKYNINSITLIGNSTSPKMYYKVYNTFYRLDDNLWANNYIQLTELNGMAIKELIPVEYGFIAIKQDDTLYFSNSYRDYLQNIIHYSGLVNQATSVGAVKKIMPVDSSLLIQGSNREFHTYEKKNYQETSKSNMCIPIKDVRKVISNGGNGGDYSYEDDIILVMNNGYKHYLTNNINAMILDSSTKYYFMNDYGISYMTDSGYFYSSVVPSRENWGGYQYRRFSGRYDKVVTDYSLDGFICLYNGRVAVYYNPYGNSSFLTSAAYYTDVKDIFYKQGMLFLIRNNTISRFYRGTPYVHFNGYDQFSSKSIKKYLFAKVSNDWCFYGLSEDGEVWRTSSSGLVRVGYSVEDIFTLNDDIVYLYKSGYLSNYGEGNRYEKYANMLVAPNFITLKLMNKDDLVYISTKGITVGYIGDFDQTTTNQYLKSTQFHIGKHQDDGVAFKYKVFTDDENSVEEVLYNQEIDHTWTAVNDLDIIQVQDGYYIGVVEVNAANKAIRYSYMKAKATKL